MYVLYDVISSDHRPMHFVVEASASVLKVLDTNKQSVTVSDWAACDQDNLVNYSLCLEQLLKSVTLPPYAAQKIVTLTVIDTILTITLKAFTAASLRLCTIVSQPKNASRLT
jgi:hypothetical protein